jgi:MOSC domain-containing protein
VIHVGRIAAITRYPVKSMAGAPTEAAFLGMHGLDGDRRFAFRRAGFHLGHPWLSASHLPELLLYRPEGVDTTTGEPLPTHVRTPREELLELRSAALLAELTERWGGRLELRTLPEGAFDDAPLSVITRATIDAIGREAGATGLDPRRFRANIVVEAESDAPFHEDGWIGGTLAFGDADPAPAVRVNSRDVRCMMINLDPDTAKQDARVMKTVVRLNKNNAGVYATALRTGHIRVGERVSLVTTRR